MPPSTSIVSQSVVHALLGLCVLLSPTVALALGNTRTLDPEDRSGNWSLGTAFRWEESPYLGEGVLPDFLPTLNYAGERFFLDTTRFGWHAVDDDRWQLDVIGNYALDGYNDFSGDTTGGDPRPPEDPLSGLERKSALEAGAELTRKTPLGRFSLELRQDISNVHDSTATRLRWSKVFRYPSLQLEPYVEWDHWSADRADYYFGVREGELGSDAPAVDVGSLSRWGVGAAVRYAFWNNHNISLNAAYRQFDKAIEDSPIIDERAAPFVQLAYHYELNDSRVPRNSGDYNFFRNNGNPWSLRVAGGCTSTTKLNEIVRGKINCNYEDNGLVSLSVARRASEHVFTLPIEAWIRGGVAWHEQNDLQSGFWEGFFSIKGVFRRFPWSKYVDTRFGIGTGVSYAGRVPARENEKAENRNHVDENFVAESVTAVKQTIRVHTGQNATVGMMRLIRCWRSRTRFH